jgi:hypothetical protein
MRRMVQNECQDHKEVVTKDFFCIGSGSGITIGDVR